MFLMWTGNEFQAAGPATVNELSATTVNELSATTVNELSASRVFVCRTTKLPRVDDRRRWSLLALHIDDVIALIICRQEYSEFRQ